MGGFFRVLAALVLVAILAGLGAMTYNAGIDAGLAEAARQALASGDPAPVVPGYGYNYGPYWHGPGGWGIFGFLFFLFGIFLVFGLLRAIFGGHRGGWGGPGSRGGGWNGRSERMRELHRELHRDEEGGGGEQRPASA